MILENQNVGVGDAVVISYCVDGKKAFDGKIVKDDGERWVVEMSSAFMDGTPLTYKLMVKKDSAFIKKKV